MKQRTVTVGLVAAIWLIALAGVSLTMITTLISNVQADPPPRHHCGDLPNGKLFTGRPPNCPPGLEKQQ
jgi:hypothetical protein